METGKKWLKKFLFAFLVTAVALLIFNFTSARWEKAAALSTIAGRPGNVPIMDIDSLISQIELDRGKLLDRSTRTNLRLRNTWPERILLQLHAERESGNPGSRVLDPEISIDNTTGFPLDSAVVEIRVWKNDGIHDRDTIQFNNIGVDKLTVRRLGKTFRGDSLSVGFRSIRARAFNFCYSSGMENNSGNFNDRWFCRD